MTIKFSLFWVIFSFCCSICQGQDKCIIINYNGPQYRVIPKLSLCELESTIDIRLNATVSSEDSYVFDISPKMLDSLRRFFLKQNMKTHKPNSPHGEFTITFAISGQSKEYELALFEGQRMFSKLRMQLQKWKGPGLALLIDEVDRYASIVK